MVMEKELAYSENIEFSVAMSEPIEVTDHLHTSL